MYNGEFREPAETAAKASGHRGEPRHGTRRIACLLVADFPVAAIARNHPELRDRPFAIVRTSSARPASDSRYSGPHAQYQPHNELQYVSSHARAAGVRPGMTVAQARALAPDLVVTCPAPAAERSAADALVDAAASLSPVVEEGTPGCVWLDLAGLQRLFRHSIRPQERSGDDENDIAAELMRRARRVGLEAAVGIASGKEVALMAARCGGMRVIASDAERDFLNWLPLDMLDLGIGAHGEEVELMLARLGIRRLGELARLDVRAVGSRLGIHGVELIRIARGESSASIVVRQRVETFTESAELEYGIENLEPLGFVMRAMLEALVERLELRGLVAGDLTLSLKLADRGRDDRRVAIAAATNEVRSLLVLLNLSLEASPPSAAVEMIRITVEPRTPRPAQADLFLPPSPAPDRLEAAIARITALCGPGRVGRIAPANSWRPEAVRLDSFAPPPSAANVNNGVPMNASDTPAANVARIVMRTIRPAEEVEVMCTRETPEFVRGVKICARVVSSAGPWRRQGEWWAQSDAAHTTGDCAARDAEAARHADSWQAAAPAAYARDYYELALADGGVYRVYRDLDSGRWFADGVYD
jgi:nucleotidyltransferase/DNA polymerase involved in DNA repair